MNEEPETDSTTQNQGSPELGDIKINLNVIAGIVRLAALQVPGVADVGGGVIDGLTELFSKHESDHRGVKVTEDNQDTYAIEIRIAVNYGSDLGKTGYDVQVAVREEIMAMTGKNVSKVDVIIEGVRLEKKNTPQEDDSAIPPAI